MGHDHAPFSTGVVGAPATLTTAEAETQMAALIDSSGPGIGIGEFEFYARRNSDDRVFRRMVGEVLSLGDEYFLSSTAKPVHAAVCLDQVRRGRMALDDLVTDYLPDFAVVTSEQAALTVRNLFQYRSGIAGTYNPEDEADWAGYVDYVNGMPLLESPGWAPGVGHFTYNTAHFAILSAVAVAAAGAADYDEIFDEWRTLTGLFPTATHSGSITWAAPITFNTNTAQYEEFFKALRDKTILTSELIDFMMTDHVVLAEDGNTRAEQLFGEDWHFAVGIWVPCESPNFSCGAVTRRTTLGIGGQYAHIEYDDDYQLVISRTGADEFEEIYFARQFDTLLKQWSEASE